MFFIKKFGLKEPFYLYDSRVIKEQFSKLKFFLPKNFEIFYSIKANPNVHILDFLKRIGSKMEISSAGELEIALKAGVSSSEIIFTGPGKNSEELKTAVEKGVYLIIVESENEAEKIRKIASDSNVRQNILLRINFSSAPKPVSMFAMSGGSQKFGIDENVAERFAARIRKSKHINLFGLHTFPASNIVNEQAILENTDHIFKTTREIEVKLKINFPVIDIGGGLPVSYSATSEVKFDLQKLSSGLSLLVDTYGFWGKKIILETGRFLVGESGVYIARVVDVKNSCGKRFVIVDGGMNHLSRGALLADNHFVEVFPERKPVLNEEVFVVGNLNTPIDFITKANLPHVEIGDLISIKKVGAYGFTAAMPFFSRRSLPKEYFLYDENGELKCLDITPKIQWLD